MHTVIGVMGGGVADEETTANARELGRLIAGQGWTLVNGGRDSGVMAASAEGAHQAGGLVVGILPDDDRSGVAHGVDIVIPTGMGDARNAINVRAADVVVALRGGAGTLSEIALALKAGRPVVTLDFPLGEAFASYIADGRLAEAKTPAEAIAYARALLARRP